MNLLSVIVEFWALLLMAPLMVLCMYCKYVKVLDIYPMIMGHNIDIHCILRTTI